MESLYSTAWIGLGSNLEDPRNQITEAINCLRQVDWLIVDRVSSLYQTAPVGAFDQPDFINAVARIITELAPVTLLDRLLKVECQFGRIRDGSRNRPRQLDLDLLLYGQERFITRELILPHPRLHKRLFVLRPLMELEGDVEIPGVGSISSCIDACEWQRITKLY